MPRCFKIPGVQVYYTPGATIRHLTHNLSVGAYPDLHVGVDNTIFVWVGGNDLQNHKSLTKFEHDYHELLKLLRSKIRKTAKVVLLSLLPRAQTHQQLRVLFERANSLLQNRAQGTSGCLYLNIHSMMLMHNGMEVRTNNFTILRNPGPSHPSPPRFDLVHLSQFGLDKVQTKINILINQIYPRHVCYNVTWNHGKLPSPSIKIPKTHLTPSKFSD